MTPQQLEQRLLAIGVLPIITPKSVDFTLRLAGALAAAGAGGIEIVLRTEHGLAAIAACRQAFPGLLIGAGTVLTTALYDKAAEAGADFAISPSSSATLDPHTLQGPIPFVPGVQTPSEVTTALDRGFRLLKFYPAEPAGGVDVLADYANVFPQARFMPSGKITEQKLAGYLALGNVVSVGGSWMYQDKGAVLADAEIAARVATSLAIVAGRARPRDID